MPNNNDKIEVEASDFANWSPISTARQHAARENEDDDEGNCKYNDDNNMPDSGNDREGLAVVITSATEDASDSPMCDASDDMPQGARCNSISDDFVGDEASATPSDIEADDVNVNSGINRVSEPMVSTAERRTALRNQKQDEFVKNGARIKSLISTVLRIVAVTPSSRADSGNEENESRTVSNTDNDNQHTNIQSRYTNTDIAHARTEAQGRSEECLALKRIQGLQSQIEFFQNEISISHQANTQLKNKIDRTLEALQHAGATAANARAEADASNARAVSLSSQLNDLQSVIEETKRGMEVVRREHDEVSRSTRTVEGRLIQVESELVRAARTKNDAMKERDLFKQRAETSEKIAKDLQDQVDEYHDEVRLLKKNLIENEEMEHIRSQRTRSIETEVGVARASLLEATSAAVEAESTVASLRSVVEVLQRENKTLHNQIDESRDSFSKDRSKLSESLTIAEREAQRWKMKCEEADEEIRKLTMDKTSATKQVEQLKSRLENRMISSDTRDQGSRINTSSTEFHAVTPHVSNSLGFINSFGASDLSAVTEESKKKTHVTELPMRESSSKNAQLNSSSRQLTYAYQEEDEESASRYRSKRPGDRINICCLCSKEGGMILKCQCDNINCDKRAHAICIGKYRSSEKDDSSRTILCKKVRCG